MPLPGRDLRLFHRLLDSYLQHMGALLRDFMPERYGQFLAVGQTAERVLVHVDTESGAKDLLNNRMAYVVVSRGAHDAQTLHQRDIPVIVHPTSTSEVFANSAFQFSIEWTTY